MIEYEDKIIDVKKLDELTVLENADEDPTTLKVGERCHAKYADGRLYEASVLFISGKYNS